jgi:hypothetical protein
MSAADKIIARAQSSAAGIVMLDGSERERSAARRLVKAGILRKHLERSRFYVLTARGHDIGNFPKEQGR